ncbi:LOW QUALITY PROTEIN: hypothetical protein Cgig2_020172 [Carnegiea gigantea]|uniref:Uncharacterized protein n=1 Tax=Carnegiea gigantea TaxID=171969 RepID=A0A9Q1KWT8_9CARY|nr:LOW QUALITY PROTEIN: hypothetical protein Cgig2_020172 [Carnegiea gigantea]
MANTLGKILKDQKAGHGEKEIVRKKFQLRVPVTGLALPPLGTLHGLNCLRHKLGDGPRLVVLTYVKLEVMARLSLLRRTSPQPDFRRTKRKSYFQCFTFDFFSMAAMKPDLLLKQYHPKSPFSLGALWTGRPSGQGSDCPAHLADPSGAAGNSGPSATISTTNPLGAWPFLLSIDLPGADGLSGDEELVDTPSDDELLDKLSEEKLEEVSPEVELELMEVTLAPGLDEDGAEQGLPCVPSASSSDMSPPDICHLHLWDEDTRGRGVLATGPRGSARFKKRHCIGNLFGIPTFILSGDAGYYPAIDKGREVRELRVPALHLRVGQSLRNVPTG